MTHALAVTADRDLADDVVRLAAAAGVPLHVIDGAEGMSSGWLAAGLVIVGVDVLDDVAAAGLSRRPGVVVVRRVSAWGTSGADPDPWRGAVAIGAEEVLDLPAGERALIDRFAAVTDRERGSGAVVAVVGGCGGAGASTLAAQLAGRWAGDCLLVDADPLGGGLDVLLDAETTAGLRWPDLAATRGRVPPSALRPALPQVDGITLVSHGRSPTVVRPEALAAIVEAGRRGFGLTVVDLPRAPADLHEAVATRAVALVVVVPATVRSVAASAALIGAVGGWFPQVVAWARPVSGGLDLDTVTEVLDIPVVRTGTGTRRRGRRPSPAQAVLDHILGAR